MSATEEELELGTAIAEAELTDEEDAKVRELVAGGGIVAAAIAHVLAERDGPEPEPVKETPPPPPVAAFVVDDKKVEKEIERHLNRMAELLGPTAEQYEPCEECGAAGIRIPGPQMLPNEKYRQCPTCVGYGKVLTGSKDPQYAAQPCPTCMGRGFQEKVAQTAPGGEQAQVTQPTDDEFGTPAWMGDPNVQPRPVASGWQ